MPDFSLLGKVPKALMEQAVHLAEGKIAKLLEGKFQAAWEEHGPIEEGGTENLRILSCREYYDRGCRAAVDLILQPKAQRKLGLDAIEDDGGQHRGFLAAQGRQAGSSCVGRELAVCYFNEGVRYALAEIQAKAKEQKK